MSKRMIKLDVQNDLQIEVEVDEKKGKSGDLKRDVVEDATIKFDDISAKLIAIALKLRERLSKAELDEVELSFGVKLGGESNFIIASGTVEANLGVKLKWCKKNSGSTKLK